MNNKPIAKIDFTIVDSLRGLASLYVCIAHCRGILWIGGNYYLTLHPFHTWNIKNWLVMMIMSLTKLSGEAVIFFFVLSGFSIAYSLSYQPKPFPFLFKRFIRLYPPYILGLVLAIVVVLILKTNTAVFFNPKFSNTTALFQEINSSVILLKPITIIKALFYNPALGTIINPFWSLVYEVIFYVGALYFVRNLNLYFIISCLLFVAGYFTDIMIPNYLKDSIFYNFLFHYNFYFMAGMFIYHNLYRLNNSNLIVNKYWWVICLVFYFVMIGLESTIKESYAISFLLSVVTCTIMILNMLDKKIYIKPLIAVGRFSYTLYITHVSVLFLLVFCLFTFTNLQPPYIYSFGFWLPAVFICLGVAYLLYLLVEVRTKKYLDSLRNKTANTISP